MRMLVWKECWGSGFGESELHVYVRHWREQVDDMFMMFSKSKNETCISDLCLCSVDEDQPRSSHPI